MKGEWEAPPPQFRNLRVDPPDGHKDDYAVLYQSDALMSALDTSTLMVALVIEVHLSTQDG